MNKKTSGDWDGDDVMPLPVKERGAVMHYIQYGLDKLIMVLAMIVLTIPALCTKETRYWLKVAWLSKDAWEFEQWNAMATIAYRVFPALFNFTQDRFIQMCEDEIDLAK